MLDSIKKYAIISVIAILFAFFSFSVAHMAFEEPRYENYFKGLSVPIRQPGESECIDSVLPNDSEYSSCYMAGGDLQIDYDQSGCPSGYWCDMRRQEYEGAMKRFRTMSFIITSAIGLIAVFVGLYARSDQDVIEWIYAGLLIGGILAIFSGTASYFNDMGRFLRPIVLFIEIALIVFVSLKTSGTKKKNKRR